MCYKMAQKSYKLPACNIFALPHYFWNDPHTQSCHTQVLDDIHIAKDTQML